MTYRVLIYRGGLVFYEPGDLIYDPQEGWIGPSPEPGAELVLVDANIYSGSTVYRIRQKLEESGYRVAGFAGSLAPGVTIRFPVPFQKMTPPSPGAPMVVVAGKPATGKSAIAEMIARMTGGQKIKWAGFVKNPGRYGEVAAELEKHDPLVFARDAYLELRDIPREKVIVLDGPKSMHVIDFLAYSLSRPTILLWVEAPGWFREFILKTRGDPDDPFDLQREELFADRLSRIRERSIIVDMASNNHLHALQMLESHGIRPRLRMETVPVLMDRMFILEMLQYFVSGRGLRIRMEDIPPEWAFHTSYSRRFPSLRTRVRLQKIVHMVASAFRIIDDVLDESTTRRIRSENLVEEVPAHWVVEGAWVAIMRAMAMIIAARNDLMDGWGKEAVDQFVRMVLLVTEAVFVELKADLENRPLTPEEHPLTLKRETAFREWVARMLGEDPEKAAREGIEDQIKNDLYAFMTGKGHEARRVSQIFRKADDQ